MYKYHVFDLSASLKPLLNARDFVFYEGLSQNPLGRALTFAINN